MRKEIEYTEDAKKRIEIVKTITDTVQDALDRKDEQWNVWTLPEDRKSGNPDPTVFEIRKWVKKRLIPGLSAKEILMTVTVEDNHKLSVKIVDKKINRIPVHEAINKIKALKDWGWDIQEAG